MRFSAFWCYETARAKRINASSLANQIYAPTRNTLPHREPSISVCQNLSKINASNCWFHPDFHERPNCEPNKEAGFLPKSSSASDCFHNLRLLFCRYRNNKKKSGERKQKKRPRLNLPNKMSIDDDGTFRPFGKLPASWRLAVVAGCRWGWNRSRTASPKWSPISIREYRFRRIESWICFYFFWFFADICHAVIQLVSNCLTTTMNALRIYGGAWYNVEVIYTLCMMCGMCRFDIVWIRIYVGFGCWVEFYETLLSG